MWLASVIYRGIDPLIYVSGQRHYGFRRANAVCRGNDLMMSPSSTRTRSIQNYKTHSVRSVVKNAQPSIDRLFVVLVVFPFPFIVVLVLSLGHVHPLLLHPLLISLSLLAQFFQEHQQVLVLLFCFHTLRTFFL